MIVFNQYYDCSAKKKELFEDDSGVTMLSAAPVEVIETTPEVKFLELVTIDETPKTSIEELPQAEEIPQSTSPDTEVKADMFPTRPHYSKRVGAGSRDEDPLTDLDPTVSL